MTDLPLTTLKIIIAFFQIDSSMFNVQFILVKVLNLVGFLFRRLKSVKDGGFSAVTFLHSNFSNGISRFFSFTNQFWL